MPRLRRPTVWLVALVAALVLLTPLLSAPTQAQVTESEDAIAQPFMNYYWRNAGEQVLSLVQSQLINVNGYNVQYFEKGRLEDHRHETSDPAMGVGYGRLTIELMEYAGQMPIGGMAIHYGDLHAYTSAQHPVPPGFTGGTMTVEGGTFVPFDPALSPVPGYIVPTTFWSYITRADLFPQGWMHQIGLPLTNAFQVEIVKDGVARWVTMQAFERTILTFDPANPPEWQIERANVGTDALLALGQQPLYIRPLRPEPTGEKWIEVDLTNQWLYAYQGGTLIYDLPVSTGKDGWETPTGTFTVFMKKPLHDMRGDVQGEEWDVPNVPHVMYFAEGGYAIHGTYWHNAFGTGLRLSHGCVNLPLDGAAQLYEWSPMGTRVVIYY